MTTKNLFHSSCSLCVALLLLLAGSCKQSEILATESQKDLTGEWRITKAVRNGVDITLYTDFTQFRIRFTDDKKYTLVNPLPFVVMKEGSYALDDPRYPFRLSFSPAGDTTVTTNLTYPVVSGERNIIFSFSPGCTANTYLYTMQRVQP